MALDDFENKQLRAASKALQHRVSILSDEQWRLRGDAEASEARLREELEGARAAIFIERQKSAERSAQVAGLEEARADAEASRAIAAEEVRQLRSERQELQRRLSDLSDEQRRLGIDAEAAAAKSKEALETAFETLSMERQKSAELTDRLSEVEAARNLAETGCAAAAEKLRRLETELAARVQASAAESAAIKSLRAAQADTERENAGLRRLVDEFERTLTGERDALKEALASVADLRSALGSSTDELTQLDEMLSETRAHAAALSADREYRLAEIGGALSASRRREIDLNATVVQQANESAILSSELAEQRALARDNHGRLTAAEERHHLAVRATAALEEALSAELAYGGPVDIIVVNDGSTEAGIARKLDAVRDRLSDERCSIRIIHQSNKGLSGARNAGIATARGSFIQLLDSDDLLVAGKIDDQVSHLRNAAEIDVSISDCLFMNEMLDRVEYYDRLVAGFEYTLDDFAYNWERGFSIPIHCALFHRRVFERLQFPDTVKAKEDWIFWITLVSGGGRLAYMGSRTAVYRVHDKSMCRNMPALGRQWLKAATEIDGIIGDRCPGFMDEAVDWYVKVYRDGSRGDAVEAEPLPERRGAPASLGSLSMPAMLTGKPKISAIVPVFGHYDYLFDCISSLALQEVDGLEVVIVEDGSPDPRVRDLLETIPKASDAVKVHYNEANRGIAETQNIAVKMARGDYVAFVDCDDKLPPRALARALTFMEENGGCDYFFSDRFDIDTSDSVIRLARYGGYEDNDRRFTGEFLPDLLNGMIASHLKIVRRSGFERVHGFDPEFSGVQDWELALKIAEFGKFLYLPEPLYLHRIHPKSVTSGDVRGQFHRTNCLRRKFAPRLLKLDDRVRRTFRNATIVLGEEPVRILDIAAAWRHGPVVLDASRALTRENLWMVREFNSYIDAIIWSAPDIYPALLGYVWSPDILKRA